MLPSYPKILQVGGSGTKELLDGEVIVQEKVDGSQFSFSVTPNGLMYRSSGQIVNPDCCDKIFKPTIQHFENLRVKIFSRLLNAEGLIFRGEAFCRPRHNSLTYEYVPRGNFVLFDVQLANGDYVVDRETLQSWANRLEVDCVPELYRGPLTSEQLDCLKDKSFLQTSFLGGCPMEGIVIKNYGQLV